MKIVLSLLALIYTFFPYDLFPDVMVGWGWLDDLVILYLLWRFFYRGKGLPFRFFQKGHGKGDQAFRNRYDESKSREEPGTGKPPFEGGSKTKDPFEVLNVPRDASVEEIKAAYKELASKYHPDKVLHLGKEFQALAEDRFKEIQAAYKKLTGK